MFVISKTHVGMVRTVNEDALLTTGPELFALADGMGGYAAGETASREALQVLQQEAEKFKELTGTELCTAMRETVQQANKHIRQMAQNEYSIMIVARRSWQYIWRQTVKLMRST
mgnify:FL=1